MTPKCDTATCTRGFSTLLTNSSIMSRSQHQLEQEDVEIASQPETDPLAELFKLPSGQQACFFLDQSIPTKKWPKIISNIHAHGGITTTHEKKAHVILVIEENLHMPLQIKSLFYDLHENPALRKIYVKPLTFLTECTHVGSFELNARRVKKGMPGPRPREHGRQGRVDFTEDDDYHLCDFLSVCVPKERSGGRRGNTIYKRLVEVVSPRNLALVCFSDVLSFSVRAGIPRSIGQTDIVGIRGEIDILTTGKNLMIGLSSA
jgi:hypothetical protein